MEFEEKFPVEFNPNGFSIAGYQISGKNIKFSKRAEFPYAEIVRSSCTSGGLGIISKNAKERQDFLLDLFSKSVSKILLKDKEQDYFSTFSINSDEDIEYLNTFALSKEEVRSVCDDGVYNIIPICVSLMGGPQELKESLGKGLWKKVCDLTHKEALNFYFIDLYLKSKTEDILKTYCEATPTARFSFYEYCKNPISKNNVTNIINAFKYFVRVRGIDFKSIYDMYSDTKTMLNQDIGQVLKFNESWSLKRLKREHDRLVRISTYKSSGISPEDVFEASSEVANIISQVIQDKDSNKIFNEVDIKVLSTGEDYMEESILMNHCICSAYARKAKNNNYVAVHAIHEDYHATMGYNLTDEGFIYIDQTYGKYNDSKIPERIREVNKIIESVVSHNMENRTRIKNVIEGKFKDEGLW